jgi:hypothetical protein
MRNRIYSQCNLDSRSIWAKIPLHWRGYWHGPLHADSSTNWHGNSNLEGGHEVRTSWHCHRFHALPVHLLLQAILGRNDLDVSTNSRSIITSFRCLKSSLLS